MTLLAVAVTLFAGASGWGGGAADSPPASACPFGGWIRSETAVWLRRVIEIAGYPVDNCTESAWIATTPTTTFLIWATTSWKRTTEFKPYPDGPQTAAPIYTDGTQLVWRAQGLAIWIEPGPGRSDVLPGRTALGWLQVSARGLPRRYRPIDLMATPPAVLAACRSDIRLRAACPTKIPRVSLAPIVGLSPNVPGAHRISGEGERSLRDATRRRDPWPARADAPAADPPYRGRTRS